MSTLVAFSNLLCIRSLTFMIVNLTCCKLHKPTLTTGCPSTVETRWFQLWSDSTNFFCMKNSLRPRYTPVTLPVTMPPFVKKHLKEKMISAKKAWNEHLDLQVHLWNMTLVCSRITKSHLSYNDAALETDGHEISYPSLPMRTASWWNKVLFSDVLPSNKWKCRIEESLLRPKRSVSHCFLCIVIYCKPVVHLMSMGCSSSFPAFNNTHEKYATTANPSVVPSPHCTLCVHPDISLCFYAHLAICAWRRRHTRSQDLMI